MAKVASGVAVSGVALVEMTGPLPAAYADPAYTEPASVIDWQPIINCESGGDAKATNRSSTASGLVQFLDSSWAGYGGLKYGRRAKDATPAQQLEIADAAYARSGLTPWAASRHCWGGHAKTVTAGRPAPARPAPARGGAHQQAGPLGVKLGVRDRDGRGWYRCEPAELSFAACNPDTIGQIEQYPVYDGHTASVQAPAAAASVVVNAAMVTPLPAAHQTPPPGPGASIVATARTWQGVKYRWGGNSRAGVDCSGLTQQVLAAHGVRAPRTADAQRRWARPVNRAQARPGDLVFRVKHGVAYHVAIYVGGGQMIEAPDVGRHVSQRPVPTSGRVEFGRVP